MSTLAAVERWPLVGRWDELAAVELALAGGAASGVVIFGAAGVGKTRIAEEMRAQVERTGRTTRRAIALDPAASTPLGALAHLLPADVVRGAVTGEDASVIFGQAFDAFAAQIEPTLLLIDDVHLLDATSLSLVAQLAANRLVFVLATARTGEPVSAGLAALLRIDGVERIDLRELTRDEVETLLHLALGGPVAAPASAALWGASKGNVLYLRELVQSARGSGALRNTDGVWTLSGPIEGSGRLTDMLAERLVQVDAAGLPVLHTVAVCRRIALDHALELAPFDVLETLERTGLLSTVDDDRRRYVTLSHPLYGELVRASMGGLAARRLLADEAARVQRDGARRRDDPLLVAGWLVAAGRPVDPNVLLQAARLARYAHDFPHVEQLARAARREIPDAEAAALLGEALYEQGSFAEAEAALSDAEELCRRDRGPDDDVAVDIATVRSINLLWGLQRGEDAVAVLERARAEATLAATSDRLLPAEAGTLLLSGRPADALALLADHPPSDDTRPRVGRAVSEASALTMVGRYDEALSLARRAFDEHMALGDVLVMAHPGVHVVNQASALAESGSLAEAMTVAESVHAFSVDSGVPIAMMWATSALGYITLLSGRIATARRWYSECAAAATTTGFVGVRRLALAGVAMCAAMLGDNAAALAAADEIRPVAGERTFVAPELWSGPAWAALSASDPERARDLLRTGADDAARTGHRTIESRLLHDVARIGAPELVTERLTALSELCDGVLVPARAAHADALVRHDAAALDAVAGEFSAMGANLYAAEAAVAAVDAWRRVGEPRRASAAQERATALIQRCEGARTPALVSAESVVPLTRREREIAVLAAEGLSSKQIGERLFLSARTIDNHLQRVFTKLGVTRRAELAAALGQRGDAS